MFKFQKIVFVSFFFLILFIGLTSAFREPYLVKFTDNSKCKQDLSIATPEDSIEILMPEGYCYDIGINLKIDESWCGRGGIPKLNFNSSKEGNYIKCEISLKELYEDACWDAMSKSTIGEITNKYWEIQFGWANDAVASYVKKLNIKVLNEDDYKEKCAELNKSRLSLWIGIPLLGLSTIFSILPKKRKNKNMKILEIIGILAGGILTLLGILKII